MTNQKRKYLYIKLIIEWEKSNHFYGSHFEIAGRAQRRIVKGGTFLGFALGQAFKQHESVAIAEILRTFKNLHHQE